MWVNGEKYIFSEHIVEGGQQLYEQFKSLLACITSINRDLSSPNLNYDFDQIEEQNRLIPGRMKAIREELSKFDTLWTIYEQSYIFELMVIEGDARLFVTDSIKVESDLQTAEKTQTPCSSIVKDLKQQLIA
jgi:hypothetical protein